MTKDTREALAENEWDAQRDERHLQELREKKAADIARNDAELRVANADDLVAEDEVDAAAAEGEKLAQPLTQKSYDKWLERWDADARLI